MNSRLKLSLGVAATLAAAGGVLYVLLSGNPESSSLARPTSPAVELPRAGGPVGEGLGAGTGETASRQEVGGAPPPSQQLRIEVLNEDETPVARADVVLLRETRVLAHGTTGADGRTVVPMPEGRAEVAVVRGPALLYRGVLAAEEGSATLHIPLGALVEGTVLVEGAPPRQPLVLTLETARGAARPPSPPAFLAAFLGLEPRGDPAFLLPTGPGGDFRFSGLPSEWSGRLVFPRGYVLETENPETFLPLLDLPHPATGLVLRLRPVPAITGRVLAPGRADPVPATAIRFEFLLENGSTGGSLEADAEGRFRIPLNRGLPRLARLDFQAPGTGSLALEIRDVPASGKDLGDVVLGARRSVPFRTVDDHGEAVAGSVARIPGDFDVPPSDPTDAGGGSALEKAPLGAFSMVVDALGYRRAVVSVPPRLSSPLPVVLVKSTQLEILLATQDGEPAAGTTLILASSQPLFDEDMDEDSPSSVQEELGGSPRGRETSVKTPGGPPSTTDSVPVPEEGRVLLTGIRPGVPIHVEVFDPVPGSAPLVEAEVVPLHEGEWRRMEIRVPGKRGILSGRVVDAQGRPVVGAAILVRAGGGDPSAGPSRGARIVPMSDAEGRFRVAPFFQDHFDLEATHAGFLPAILLDAALPPDGGELEVVLEEGVGRTVWAEVAGPSGERLPIPFLQAKMGPFGLRGKKLGDGRFRFDRLPAGEMELSALIGGRTFRKIHSTDVARAVLEVPASGSVRITWKTPLPPDTLRLLVLIPLGDSNQSFHKALPAGPEAPGSLRLPLVFPGDYRVQILFHAASTGYAEPPKETWNLPGTLKVTAGQEASLALEDLAGS